MPTVLKEQLRALPARILADLNQATDQSGITEQICQEITLQSSVIEQQVVDQLQKKIKPNFASALQAQDPALLKLIAEFCAGKVAQENLAREHIKKLVDLSTEAMKCNKIITLYEGEKQAVADAYYKKHGNVFGLAGLSWGEFQPAIDKADANIKASKGQLKILQSEIAEVMCKLKTLVETNIDPAHEFAAIQARCDAFDVEQDASLKMKLRQEFAAEFQKGIGHELITAGEWAAALANMVQAKFNIAKNGDPRKLLEGAIIQEQSKLAELIITRSVYATEVKAGATIDQTQLRKSLEEQIKQVYGYKAYKQMEGKGVPQAGVIGYVMNEYSNLRTEGDWLAINTGIIARLSAYSVAEDREPEPTKIQSTIMGYAAQLQADTLPKFNGANFNAALASLTAEINRIEQERLTAQQALRKQYNADLKELIKKYPDSDKQELVNIDLTKPIKLKAAIDNLTAKLAADIDALEKQEQYTHNKQFAENMQLFGLERFAGKLNLTPEALIAEFKTSVIADYNKEQSQQEQLQTIETKVAKLQQQVKTEQENYTKYHQALLQLTTNVTDETLSKNKAEIDDCNNALLEIDKRLTGHIAELQTLCEQRVQCKRDRGQLHAKIELNKRYAMGTVPPTHPDFLKDYKNFLGDHRALNLEQFAQEMQSLADKRDQESLNKLLALAAEVINILPTLDLPDAADSNGLHYSDHNINDLVKSYLILAQAKTAAQRAVKNEPTNLYLAAIEKDIDYAFSTLANKILVHPLQEAIMGFEVLPEEKQLEYIKRAAAINTETPAGKAAAQKLNEKIGNAITKAQYDAVKEGFDKQLAVMGVIGARIQEPGNEFLYSGLINNQIVLNELMLMQDRLENYLANLQDAAVNESKKAELDQANLQDAAVDKSKKAAVYESKKAELDQIKAEISVMQNVMATDLKTIYEIFGVAVDKESMVASIVQGTAHYLNRLAYIAGGAAAGYGLGKLGSLLCDLLGSLPGFSAVNVAGAATPFVTAAAGAAVGVTAGEIATAHDGYNLTSVLSAAAYQEIKTTDAAFVAASNGAAISTGLANIKSNYIKGVEKLNQGFRSVIGNFINTHKVLFFGSMAVVGVAIGVAISVVTMGAAAPAVAAMTATAGAGIVAAVYGGGIALSVAGALGVGTLIRRLTLRSPLQLMYDKALSEVKTSKVELDRPIAVQLKDIELNDLIRMIEQHFKEQTQLVAQRIRSYEPNAMSTDEEQSKFENKLTRELYCLQKMQDLKHDLKAVLQDIEKNTGVHPFLVQDNKTKLKQMLISYLNNNYQAYHRPHLVETSVAETLQVKNDLSKNMDDRGKERKRHMIEPTRKYYIPTGYTTTAGYTITTAQTKLKKDKEAEQEQIRALQAIKTQLGKV